MYCLFVLQLIAMGLEDVAKCGGADGPFELILEYVGGRMPHGLVWNYIRSWRALCQVAVGCFLM